MYDTPARLRDGRVRMSCKPALLVRKFVEDYHVKLEEDFVFPSSRQLRTGDTIPALRILGHHFRGGRGAPMPGPFGTDSTRSRFARAYS